MNPLGFDPGNPMNLFNKAVPPDQAAALRQYFSVLGGLGYPNMHQQQPQPQMSQMEPILGGLKLG